jgi:adenylate cyclase
MRLTMAWALGSGVPVLGIAALALAAVLGADLEPEVLGGAIAFLAAVALMVGLIATRLVADSVADPLGAVRSALGRVERGDLSAGVEVDDGSEVGLVQAGLNRMVAGLRERERLRDLFGRHVGRDVAEAALDGDVELGGEEREVAVLFVDVVGSTRLAARRPPVEVVALLNAFFAVVVDVVEAHQGWVNKFEGDGALCVFGAPAPDPRAAACALAAARDLHARLVDELGELDAAIGVSAGTAVAGNVGAEHRFEYTVLGDPVNEAARLCELAKQRPQRLVASDAAVERAGSGEARHWSLGDAVVLRGRDAPTRLATAAGA